MSLVFERDHLLIGGRQAPPAGSEFIDVVSPATEEVVGRVPLASPADVDDAVAAARHAFDHGPWPRMSVDERRRVLLAAADRLDAIADELSVLAVQENGTLIRNRSGHIAGRVRYFAGLEVPAPEYRVAGTGEQAAIVREPIGVVAAIVPWNAPIALSVTKFLPALLVGCSVVLKPAPETPLTAYPLVEAFLDAGLPPGVLNVVPADREVSELLVRHPDVDLVSFTGSTGAGKAIGAICAQQVKRCGLELGGKSPVILLDDVDAAAVAPGVLGGGMLLNNGEACCAWTRILVPAARHDELVEAFCGVVRDVRVGDPLDTDTDLGPLISRNHRDRVESYIASGREDGALIAIGGGRPADLPKGWYVEPTILAAADNAMRSSREEIFGPVVSVIPYADEAEAIAIANDSSYGLSSGIFTSDYDRGLALAGQIRAGTVGINSLAFNIEFPFGGYKESGIGRQHGPESLDEFLEIKTIGVGAAAPKPVPHQESEVSIP
jgi:acyl-CoA reductase-like NAD-dependent aldehyde dehydrogenase